MQLSEVFISRTKAIIGKEWDSFEKSLLEESPVSIRLNPDKPAILEIPGLDLSDSEKVAWASNAFYLKSRPVFTLDPMLHAGCYYVQEASSMYLEQIIKKHVVQPGIVLDLCAAPGGKSTQLLSVLPKGSLLVANEVIRQRSNILAENITKWGNPNAIVTNNDPKEIGQMDHFFDVILADVPCSGEGMFRKDPASIQEWSVGNVNLCAERQRRIIADIWPALKPDGILIYSTCTYNREENEENIDWICKELNAEMIEEPKRFMPHKTKGEGFFIAALRKKSESQVVISNGERIVKSTKSNLLKNLPRLSRKVLTSFEMTNSNSISSELKNQLIHSDEFTFFSEGNIFKAIPSVHFENYHFLKSFLKIVSSGIGLGELKGKDIIPEHALAMSSFLNLSAFPIWNTDKANALKFLQKEAFTNGITSELPRGYVLVAFKNQPLGFIKNIGNRANNLYPQEWRIRMDINKLQHIWE